MKVGNEGGDGDEAKPPRFSLVRGPCSGLCHAPSAFARGSLQVLAMREILAHREFLPRLRNAPSHITRFTSEMSGPFYTRWVPPSKAASTTKILPPAHSPVSKPHPAPASLEAVPQKKKKSKRKSIEQPLEPIETPNDDISYVDADVSQQAPDSIKKPKKRKRELKVDGQAEEEEATPKKHKAILSKFDKVKKAEAARGPAEQAGEGNDEDEKAGEELHGSSACTYPYICDVNFTQIWCPSPSLPKYPTHLLHQPSPRCLRGSRTP